MDSRPYEQIHRLRAQMIEQAAQASAVAASEVSQGLVCEQCGRPEASPTDGHDAGGRCREESRWKWNARM